VEDVDCQSCDAAGQESASSRSFQLPPQIGWPAAVLPAFVGVVSWTLGGDTLWWLVTAFGAIGLIAFGCYTLRGELERPRSKEWLLLGYLALVWAPWAAIGYFFPIEKVKIAVPDDEPAAALRISYNDELLTTLDPPRNWSFPIRGHFRADQLKVETLGPAGWRERTYRNYGQSVTLDSVPTIDAYIDNRKHGVATLEFGELKIVISADRAERRRIVAPLLGSPVAVRIDGSGVVQLADQPVFIDVLGTRTYHFHEVQYQGGLLHLLRAATSPLGEAEPIEHPAPIDAIFLGRRLYPLPHKLDHFLEKAPSAIKVTAVYGMPLEGTGGVVSRYQLTEVDAE
jgi:hypothetical protein